MTAKEKAQDMVDTYRIILIHTDTDVSNEILCTTVAKCCALAAVDEILDDDYCCTSSSNDMIDRNRYWKQVKEEIERL